MKLKIGRTYRINHSRQGKFQGKLLSLYEGGLKDYGNTEFGDFEITSGVATYFTRAPATVGDIVTVRLCLATFDILGAAKRKKKKVEFLEISLVGKPTSKKEDDDAD